MSSVTSTKPGPAIGRAAARPPQRVPAPPPQRVSAPSPQRVSAPPPQRVSAGASRRASVDLAQRRAQLESRWRARLEQVTELSLAYHDAAQQARDGSPTSQLGAVRRAELLARRTVAERQALADIEAALDRLSNGQYGRCEQCRQPISAALLARQPQARYCSACACLALQGAG